MGTMGFAGIADDDGGIAVLTSAHTGERPRKAVSARREFTVRGPIA
jgi:hypothetical protein